MRKFKKFLKVVGTLYILITVLLYFFQEKLIFQPTKLPQEHQFIFSEPFSEFSIHSEDGAVLNALHFKREQPKGVILYFHGNAGDLSRWGEIVTFYAKKEYDIVVMDYRTYGKSSGKLGEQELFADAQLFYNYVLERYPENKVIVFGRSLGAAIATHVASKNNPKKLVLETPFYNLYDAAKYRFSFLPLKLLLRYRFETNINIQKVKCPMVIFHGTEDSVVPYASGKQLFDVAPSPKELVTIPGGDHNNLISFSIFLNAIDKALSVE